jgi:flagellar biosynthesis/type III secretory pathway protein FliH
MTSSYDRVLRAAPVSPRQYRVGSTVRGGGGEIDPRPFTVQEAERAHTQQLEQLRRESEAAVAAAYRRGYDEGTEAATERAAAQRERLTAWLTTLTEEFARTRTIWYDACEHQILELIASSLDRILGDRPAVEERVAHALSEAFQRLTGGDRVTVRCHPDDLEFVKTTIGDGLDTTGKFKHIQVVPDAHVGVNGCLVETDLGVVDARIEKQLDILKNALIECQPQTPE